MQQRGKNNSNKDVGDTVVCQENAARGTQAAAVVVGAEKAEGDTNLPEGAGTRPVHGGSPAILVNGGVALTR